MLIARGRSQMKPLGCAESVRLGMRERILDFQKAIAVGRSWSWLDLSSSVLPSRNLDISLWEKTRHPGEKEENKMEWLENTHTHTHTHSHTHGLLLLVNSLHTHRMRTKSEMTGWGGWGVTGGGVTGALNEISNRKKDWLTVTTQRLEYECMWCCSFDVMRSVWVVKCHDETALDVQPWPGWGSGDRIHSVHVHSVDTAVS